MEFSFNGSGCPEEHLGPKRDALYIVIPIIIVYILIFFVGVIGNISTCIVISRNKSLHNATNYYLFSLAISDLLLLLSGVPQEVYMIWSRYPYIFGSAFCFLRGLFAETSANASVLTITAFTVERYLAICHPFLSHTMSKLSRAVKLILTIWFCAICLAIPQALQFKIIGGPECELCYFMEPIIEHSFEVSTFLFFVTPMTLITVLYILIGLRLKSSNMMKKRNTNAGPQSKSSRKVVKMLVAVVVAFFICWAPFHAQRLYSMYSTEMPDEETKSFYLQIYAIVTYVSGILYYMSAMINPILYNIMSAKFREAFKETFAQCCCFSIFKTGRPQRSYSVLSRSAQRGPDSTESGRDDATSHTNTTIFQKSSLDSVAATGPDGKRLIKSTSFHHSRHNSIMEEGHNRRQSASTLSNNITAKPRKKKYMRVRILSTSQTKMGKFWQICQCHKRQNEEQHFTAYYSSPKKASQASTRKQSNEAQSPYDISNSSLKDVETGALEDELTAYMKGIKPEVAS